MTGKRYYLSTIGAWQRHTHRFAGSHFAVLTDKVNNPPTAATGNCCPPPPAPCTESTRILVLVEADEGVHLALDDDPAFEALPHPLAQKTISSAAQAALAPHGVASGATTFAAAEALALVHPLLRHTVF